MPIIKKFISLVAIAAIFLSSCGKINDRINDLDSRLDLLEGTTIPSIDEQIDNINVSITDLKSVDSELHQLIDALKAEADEHASLIVALQDKDTELEDDIAALEEYVDSEITATEDWAEATFATLEQYAEVQSEISSIKALIEQYKTEITEAYTEAIANAIITSETSMKQWVGEQLAGYYTIAEIDAKLESLQQSINDLNESLADEIATLSGRVDAMKTELTDAYTKAISEAIETNNGVIDAKISEEINTVNTRIDSEVEAINKRIDSLEERIEALEDIINKIQALDIEFDNTEGLVCYPGASVEVGYTIVGGDVKTEIESFGDGGWSASVIKASDTTGKIRVKSPEDATSGKVIVLATSGIGGSVMKSLYFEQGVLADIQNTYEVDWEACTLQVALKTNLDYTVNIPADTQSWISVADTRAALRTETLTFTIAENSEDEPERSAVIEIVNELGEVLQSFEIVQKMQYIEFADPCVKSTCIKKFDSNDDGEISYPEALAVTVIDGNFFGELNATAKSFDELRYFSNLTTIQAHAFSNCSVLTSISIPNSVTWIGGYAFNGCSSLTSVTIPNNITSIEDYTFAHCHNITDITIPNRVTSIRSGAFYECDNLTSVTLPDSVVSIGKQAFYGCGKLQSVSCMSVTPPIGDIEMFYNNAYGRMIYVPTESVDAYKNAEYWSEYTNSIVLDQRLFLTISEPTIVKNTNRYDIRFNVKTNDNAVDLLVGAQLWKNYDFEQYWDPNDWSQIQAFFLFRKSVGADSLAAAQSAEGTTIAFSGFDKEDYVFFFEALNAESVPTQFAIRVDLSMIN